MMVTVEYIGHIKNLVENRHVEQVEIPEKSTMTTLLTVLSEKHGGPFKKAVYEKGSLDVKPNFIVTVNGYLLNQLQGLDTRLKDGDTVILMSVVSGG
jgi:MoaD family protein